MEAWEQVLDYIMFFTKHQNKMENEKIPPVKIGEKLKLGITGWGKKGNPMMKYKGYTIFLEKFEEIQIKIKEMIPIQITKVFNRFAFAQLVERKITSKRPY